MGGPCDCDGRTLAELDNFFLRNFVFGGATWPSAEHCYQAAKFPADPRLQERIRALGSGMETWHAGQQTGALRPDWEEAKVEAMYRANLAKFGQHKELRNLLVGTRGPIAARGGAFWKTWNEVLLERVREELRDPATRDATALRDRIRMMDAYREAVRAGDSRWAEAVTRAAARREEPPARPSPACITVEGVDVGGLRVDPLQPEVNGQPHFVGPRGSHLYLGRKCGYLGRQEAWVLDEVLSADEVKGTAFLEGGGALPEGRRTWAVWDEAAKRHVPRDLVLRLGTP